MFLILVSFFWSRPDFIILFFFPHGLDLTHCFYHRLYSKKFFMFPQKCKKKLLWRKQAIVRLMREQNWNTYTRKSSLSIPLLTRNFTVAFRQLEKEGLAKISSFQDQSVYFLTILFHKKWRIITFLLRYNTGLRLLSLVLDYKITQLSVFLVCSNLLSCTIDKAPLTKLLHR